MSTKFSPIRFRLIAAVFIMFVQLALCGSQFVLPPSVSAYHEVVVTPQDLISTSLKTSILTSTSTLTPTCIPTPTLFSKDLTNRAGPHWIPDGVLNWLQVMINPDRVKQLLPETMLLWFETPKKVIGRSPEVIVEISEKELIIVFNSDPSERWIARLDTDGKWIIASETDPLKRWTIEKDLASSGDWIIRSNLSDTEIRTAQLGSDGITELYIAPIVPDRFDHWTIRLAPELPREWKIQPNTNLPDRWIFEPYQDIPGGWTIETGTYIPKRWIVEPDPGVPEHWIFRPDFNEFNGWVIEPDIAMLERWNFKPDPDMPWRWNLEPTSRLLWEGPGGS